jgi:hypothetical protein
MQTPITQIHLTWLHQLPAVLTKCLASTGPPAAAGPAAAAPGVTAARHSNAAGTARETRHLGCVLVDTAIALGVEQSTES